MHKQTRRYSVLLLLLCLVAVIGAFYLKRQPITDWWRLRGYEPPVQVAELATNTTMTRHGRQLFYINRPAIEDKQIFNQHCPAAEHTIVLACYVSGQGIYIYKVTDQRLNGEEEVAASHEMLHAAYDRLSDQERSTIDALLTQAYQSVTNQRIRSNIASYKKGGADITNELHSILGTEVQKLPPSLEQYYRKYFTNRQAIVQFSDKYEKAFSDRRQLAERYLQQITTLEQRLSLLKQQIGSEESYLNTQYNVLLDERSMSDDPQVFNAKAAAYNQRVGAYRQQVDAYNQLVTEHNNLLVKYNAVTLEERQLLKSLNSRSNIVPGE